MSINVITKGHDNESQQQVYINLDKVLQLIDKQQNELQNLQDAYMQVQRQIYNLEQEINLIKSSIISNVDNNVSQTENYK